MIVTPQSIQVSEGYILLIVEKNEVVESIKSGDTIQVKMRDGNFETFTAASRIRKFCFSEDSPVGIPVSPNDFYDKFF